MQVRVRASYKGKQAITPGKDYLVLELDDEYYRILNDAGDPVLIRKWVFGTPRGVVPRDWIRLEFPPDGYRVCPARFAEGGFWDRYFDGDVSAARTFDEVHREVQLAEQHRED
jgi:hypothetical protein